MTAPRRETARVSWDAGRASAPPRPRLDVGTTSSPERIVRPRRLGVAGVLMIVAGVILLVAAITTAMTYDAVRDGLIAIINTELDEDYADDDVLLATNLLLGVSWSIAVVFTVVQMVCVVLISAKRSRSARNSVLIATILAVPATAVTVLLRDAGGTELVVAASGILMTCVATVIVFTPRVSLWLRQADQQERKPLIGAESR